MRFHLPENLEKYAIAVLLAALAAIMLVAAACRHLAPEWHVHPLTAGAACLAWMSSLAMARAAYLGLHVRVSVLEGMVSPKNRKRLYIVSDAVFFIFAILAFGVGVAVVADALRHPSPNSHPLIYASIPVGAVLTMMRLVERLRGHFGE